MENTLENKAKFFAQYWGIKCLELDKCISYVDGWIDGNNANVFKIFLKSTENITESELLDIANIMDLKSDVYFSKEIKKGMKRTDWARQLINNGNFQYYGGQSMQIIFVYQYLQSKGYALPYMGLSVETLVSYGWIKLIE